MKCPPGGAVPAGVVVSLRGAVVVAVTPQGPLRRGRWSCTAVLAALSRLPGGAAQQHAVQNIA